MFRNRRLRPGVIHRMHGFRRRFSYSSSTRKSIPAVLLATAFCSKGNSAKEVNLSGSCIPAISERLEPGSEKNGNAINFIVFSGVCYKNGNGILPAFLSLYHFEELHSLSIPFWYTGYSLHDALRRRRRIWTPTIHPFIVLHDKRACRALSP